MEIQSYKKSGSEAQRTPIISASSVRTAENTTLQSSLDSINNSHEKLVGHFNTNIQRLAEEKSKMEALEARLAALENK